MIWFLSFCFIPSLVFAAGNLRSAYFKSSKNKYLAGQPVKKIDSPSLISCCQACLEHSWCTSANFKEPFGMSSNGSCELIKKQFSPVRDKAKLTDRPGTTFTRKMFSKDCNSLPPHLPSGVYIIQPLADEEPIDVYCEMAIHGGGFTFLPRGLTRTLHADLIVNALFRDRKNVLLKLKKRVDHSESYTLIQPHPNFAHTEFAVLVNSFAGYTEPINAFMKDYILFGIIPASAVRNGSEGFTSNGNIIQFSNCDGNPNSYFAFFPNYNLEPPSNRSDYGGVADIWRSKAIAINYTDHNMPDEFFFFTEVHFGGCGTYSSSDQWTKYGFNATAIGIR
ncbi:uncharacterized protein [Porites lutea]|uniref:uncharacterized protein n=1 Tax=Porites lutea TaxID=51062 RepID=UPI003CC68FE6